MYLLDLSPLLLLPSLSHLIALFISQIRIPASVAPHFALFESLDPRFDRKLGPDEVPHAIYVANYSTAAATCILLKKWVFSLKLEAALMSSGNTGFLLLEDANPLFRAHTLYRPYQTC